MHIPYFASILALTLLVLPLWGQHTACTKDGKRLDIPTVSAKTVRPEYHNLHVARSAAACGAAPVMLVVSRPDFRQAIQPFISWKRHEGYRVEEYYSGTNNCDSIRAHLLWRHRQSSALHPAPAYILIVGDTAHIKPFKGRQRISSEMSQHYTDLYFGEYTGDYYPEAVVARWPVADVEQLNTLIDKTLRYEQGLFYDSAATKRVLLVSGKENTAPAPTTTNGQTRYLSRTLAGILSAIDTHCYYNPASEGQLDEIVDVIASGTSLVCYTGHGIKSGWHYPTLGYETTDSLSESLPTVYINNCCHTNNFTGDCMGSHLLGKADGGAVAVIGATNSTLWEEDYLWSVGGTYTVEAYPTYTPGHPGAFDRLLRHESLPWDGQAHTIGQLLHAGNHAVSKAGSNYDAYYWEVYHLLGDPTLVPFVGTRHELSICLTGTQHIGSSAVCLKGTPHAYVAISVGDSLLGCGHISADSTACLPLIRPLSDRPTLLVATASGHTPLISEFSPTQATGCMPAVVASQLDGDTLRLTVRNMGGGDGTGLTLTVAQDSTERQSGLVLMSSSPQTTIAHLGTGEETLLNIVIATAAGGDDVVALHTEIYDGESLHITKMCFERHTALPYIADLWAVPSDGGVQHVAVVVSNPGPLAASCTIGDNSQALAPHSIDTCHVVLAEETDAIYRCLDITLHCGQWQNDTHYCLPVGRMVESFERGDFSTFPWDNSTSARPWMIDPATHHSGQFSARSGAIGHNQRSELALTVFLPADDTITYWHKSSCEENYDKLSFFVDGTFVESTTGEMGWLRVRHALTRGHHLLLWRYTKDASGSSGSDCCWIDDIVLPKAVWDEPMGDSVATVSITAASRQPQITLSPNPARRLLTISGLSADIRELWIYDLDGRGTRLPTVMPTSGTDGTGSTVIDLEGLSRGIYLVVLHHRLGISTHKLVIQ